MYRLCYEIQKQIINLHVRGWNICRNICENLKIEKSITECPCQEKRRKTQHWPDEIY